MISPPKNPSPGPVAGNVTPQKIATNQRAVPWPYFAGWDWFPVTWLCSNIYERFNYPNKQKAGKGSSTTGHTYGGTVIGGVALGPVDAIAALELDGKVVWEGLIQRDGANPLYAGALIPDLVGWRLMWGTAGQPADDLIVPTCGEEHPNYDGKCYLILRNWTFGPDRREPGNARVFIGRAPRFEGLDESLNTYGACGVTTLAEFTANKWYGLGRPDLVHLDSWAAQSEAIKRGGLGFMSPSIKTTQTVQQFFGNVLENFDGWLRPNGDQLELGRFPHDGVIPEDLPELSYHDFIEFPKWSSPGDEGVITDALVVYRDRANKFEEDTRAGINAAARQRLGEPRPKTFRRPFIITSYQATEQAQELAKFYARPEESVSGVSIRREKVANLRAGDRFILNDHPNAARLVVRILDRDDPRTGGATIFDLVTERGAAPLSPVEPIDPEPNLDAPAPVTIEHARIFQLPAELSGQGYNQIAPLAERPSTNTVGFHLHFSVADVSYDELVTVNRWALRGTLDSALSSGAATLTLNAAGLDLATLQSQSTAAQNDNTLLAIVGNEVLSIGAVTALGGGQYTLAILRGRAGSAAASHADDAVVYVIASDDLVTVAHADFPRSPDTRYFKLQPFTHDEAEDLGDALKLTFTFADTRPPGVADLTATAGTGRMVGLKWTVGARAVRHRVYRHTTSTFGSATLIGEAMTGGYVDIAPNGLTPYWYWVVSLDENGVTSATSNAATVTTGAATGEGVAPATPSAPTSSSTATVVGVDGTITNKFVVTIPSMPSRGQWMHVKARPVSDSGWIVYDVWDAARTDSPRRSTISGIPGGVGIDVVLQAYSLDGTPSGLSSILTVSSPGAPNPAAPASVTSSDAAADMRLVPGSYNGAGGAKFSGGLLKWTESTSKDVICYEVRATTGVPTVYRVPVGPASFPYYSWMVNVPSGESWQVRALARSGAASGWVTSSTTPEKLTYNYATENMAQQASNNVAVTGITTGAGVSSTKVLVRYQHPGTVYTTTGGGTSQNVSVSLTGKGFSTAPDGGSVNLGTPGFNLTYAPGSSSSSVAVLKLSLQSGGAIPNGNGIGFTAEFYEL